MGGPKWYSKEEGYADNQYHPLEEKKIVNGVIGEILVHNTDKKGVHTSMPSYSGESDIYFRQRQNRDDKKIVVIQGTLYIGHQKYCDFDWGHEHQNSNGRKLQNGVVHVQFYESDREGNRVRANKGDARYMNNTEIKKFKPIILAFNPDAKFRPSKNYRKSKK